MVRSSDGTVPTDVATLQALLLEAQGEAESLRKQVAASIGTVQAPAQVDPTGLPPPQHEQVSSTPAEAMKRLGQSFAQLFQPQVALAGGAPQLQVAAADSGGEAGEQKAPYAPLEA